MALVLSLIAMLLTDKAESHNVNGHLILSSIFNPLARLPNATVNNLGLLEVDLVELFQEALNFTYEIRVPHDLVSLGTIINGTGTGTVGQLIRKEVDFSSSGAEITHDKYAYVDATAYLFTDTMQIMIPYPEIVRKADALVAIYSLEVWMLIIASTIVVAVILWLLIRQDKLANDSVFLLVVGLIASQGAYFRHNRLAFRLVWAVWCLSFVVIINVYTGTLTSMLTAPSYRFLANSVDDVAKNENIMPYLIKGFLAEDYVMGTNLPNYRPIQNRLVKHQELRLSSNSDFLTVLKKSECGIFLGTSLLQNALIAKDARSSGKCHFTLAKKTISSRYISFLLQKNSPLTEMFNQKILRLNENGILERLLKKHVPSPERCVVKEGQLRNKLGALRLSQLSDALCFLAFGLSLSFLAFIGERIVAFYQRSSHVL